LKPNSWSQLLIDWHLQISMAQICTLIYNEEGVPGGSVLEYTPLRVDSSHAV